MVLLVAAAVPTVVSEASGTRLKASAISASVKPFFCKKDFFESVVEPRTCSECGVSIRFKRRDGRFLSKETSCSLLLGATKKPRHSEHDLHEEQR